MYEFTQAAFNPARALAGSAKVLFGNPFNPFAHTAMGRGAAAAAELVERTTRRYKKPAFGIKTTVVAGRTVAVREQAVWEKPFCRLVQFSRDLPAREAFQASRILIVAPLSGHYASLLRGTVEGLLPHHEVYISDWADARTVPLEQGGFDLDGYVDYVIEMIRLFKGDVHCLRPGAKRIYRMHQAIVSRREKLIIDLTFIAENHYDTALPETGEKHL